MGPLSRVTKLKTGDEVVWQSRPTRSEKGIWERTDRARYYLVGLIAGALFLFLPVWAVVSFFSISCSASQVGCFGSS
jgi:hypothetical protein